ncbi:trafficking protein particle complex subunit 11-like [Xenia sp. Carnegie-2017]|uniref:trafficking protein particle complex subunit 11-like n=1 Tax=Xenia sp. Carnegie-2017 TaxID=2897299 RepID=UPI001F045B35|nr:trafficking protein particle complex subunit 11-like [Xenia sp. Carnegie-2017]
MAVASDLPTELTARPLSFIALSGLDVSGNTAHLKIWETFTQNRQSDRIPLVFSLVETDHEYPKCKTKRTNYDWYLPKGILKTKWMNKQLHLIPSVVVYFFDLEWDHPKWKEKQEECSNTLKKIRQNLQGRNTRVAVVLVQKNAPVPPGDDTQVSERVATLCTACELSAKSLFVLPFTDLFVNLVGYITRLELAFHELAMNYYQGEAKRVKSHKEFLTKSHHQQLLVRHQFKIAFFSEIRQDTHSALKHYRQAYSLLTEIKQNEINILEIKIVAGFINYKICHLSFRLSAPLDAISQFRKHVDFFKDKAGNPDLAFEHLAWLSKQFSVFGDLFDEAIKNGLTAIQTQHPGFYYQQAANHSVIRRQLAEGLCHHISPDSVSFGPLNEAGNLEYFGQRPWRQQHQGDKLPDQTKETAGVLALQAQETMVDHCWIIIPLLSNAVSQFKKYKSPRMKRFLMVQMGEEYYHARDYLKALALLGVVTGDYRKEKWWPLLTAVLSTSLRCAYLLANIQEYLNVCVELMGQYALHYSDERTRVQMNFIRVISGDSPDHEPGCDVEAIEEAKEQWKVLMKQGPHVVNIQMSNIAAFVEVKAIFNSQRIKADSSAILDVYLRVTCPFPIRFNRLAVHFNNQNYDSLCVINGPGSDNLEVPEKGDLYLEPRKIKHIMFTFIPLPEDVGKQIEVSQVVLDIGSREVCCVVLMWNGGGASVSNNADSTLLGLGSQQNETLSEDAKEWKQLRISSKLSVLPREPNVIIEFEHKQPSLLDEIYPLKLRLTNNEDTQISNVKCEVRTNSEKSTTQSESVWLSLNDLEFEKDNQHFVSFDVTEVTGKVERQLYFKTSHAGKTVLDFTVMYYVTVLINSSEHRVECLCSKTASTTVESLEPFKTTCSLVSKEFIAVEKIPDEELFMLLIDIKCISPWPVCIHSAKLILSAEVQLDEDETDSQLTGGMFLLDLNESASECFCLVSKSSDIVVRAVDLGQLQIEWKRFLQNSLGNHVLLVTCVDLPRAVIEKVPLSIYTDLPSYGTLRTALPMSYTLLNKTTTVQEIEAKIEQSDDFMFAGSKEIHFSILPSSRHTLKYQLFPLSCGYVALPRLHLSLPRYQGDIETVVKTTVPSRVFIKPPGIDQFASII